MLVDRGCKVTVVPAKTPASDVLAMKPDGIFLSNGPGDPEPCNYAIKAIKEFYCQQKFGRQMRCTALDLATSIASSPVW